MGGVKWGRLRTRGAEQATSAGVRTLFDVAYCNSGVSAHTVRKFLGVGRDVDVQKQGEGMWMQYSSATDAIKPGCL